MKTYSIVEFIEENTVEIILSSWISPNKKTTLWPKIITPSILKRYLKNYNTVPSDDWNSVKIRVLGYTGIDFLYFFRYINFILNCSIVMVCYDMLT